jgi:hypothetical protein
VNKIIIMLTLALATAVSAQTLTLYAPTDRSAYRLGDTVTWWIEASTDETTNQGISLLGVDLTVNQPVSLSPAANDGTDLTGSDFDSAAGFAMLSAGTVDPAAPAGQAALLDVLVSQVGFDPAFTGAGHGQDTFFATGSFVASVEGSYHLSLSVTGANYWNLDSPASAEAFAAFALAGANFTVIDPAPGDANVDGVVSDADYTIWADNFGAVDATWYMGDFNGDGQVTDGDYTIWADNFNAATATPEPTSLALAVLGAIAAAGRRR